MKKQILILSLFSFLITNVFVNKNSLNATAEETNVDVQSNVEINQYDENLEKFNELLEKNSQALEVILKNIEASEPKEVKKDKWYKRSFDWTTKQTANYVKKEISFWLNKGFRLSELLLICILINKVAFGVNVSTQFIMAKDFVLAVPTICRTLLWLGSLSREKIELFVSMASYTKEAVNSNPDFTTKAPMTDLIWVMGSKIGDYLSYFKKK